MTYIENNNGYICFDEGIQPLFSDDNSHKYLFEYADTDISNLELLFEDHISKRLDITTFEIINPNDNRFINKIKALLKSMHPYYEHEIERVIAREIGEYFNRLLAYSLYVNKNPNLNPDIEEEWYIERFCALLPSPLSFISYPEGLHPSDFYHNFIKWTKISKEASKETHKYLIFNMQNDTPEDDSEFENEFMIPNMPRKKPCGFSYEIQTQKAICNMLYFVLDISAESLKSLTSNQRLYLYNTIYKTDLTIKRHFSCQSPMLWQNRCDNTRAIKEWKILTPLYEFNGLNMAHMETVPHYKFKDFNLAIEYAKSITDTKIYEEYKIETIYQLLYLEILSMLKNKMCVRKCKNCSKYFVVTNQKIFYCNRFDKYGVSCADMGSKNTFRRKLNSDPALEIYNRAYKTHFARMKKGKMSKEQLEEWRLLAKEKLELVRAGKLELDAYQKWLKE